jgi:hypothetical protein
MWCSAALYDEVLQGVMCCNALRIDVRVENHILSNTWCSGMQSSGMARHSEDHDSVPCASRRAPPAPPLPVRFSHSSHLGTLNLPPRPPTLARTHTRPVRLVSSTWPAAPGPPLPASFSRHTPLSPPLSASTSRHAPPGPQLLAHSQASQSAPPCSSLLAPPSQPALPHCARPRPYRHTLPDSDPPVSPRQHTRLVLPTRSSRSTLQRIPPGTPSLPVLLAQPSRPPFLVL